MPRRATARPVAEVPRFALTRQEAAASLGMSTKTFDERVRPTLKFVTCGQLQLFPPAELEKWVQRNARHIVDQVA